VLPAEPPVGLVEHDGQAVGDGAEVLGLGTSGDEVAVGVYPVVAGGAGVGPERLERRSYLSSSHYFLTKVKNRGTRCSQGILLLVEFLLNRLINVIVFLCSIVVIIFL
jgi:hypothetical protein